MFFRVVLLCAVAVFIIGCEGPSVPQQQPSPPKAEQKVAEPQKPPEPAKPDNWEYHEEQDPMGQGVIKSALVLSTNMVSFDFPYAGEQHGSLLVRSHPRYGNDIMLGVLKGQFLTGIDGCKILVRFDDNKPAAFWANGPSDHSTTVVFISGYSKFIKSLIQAKKVMIEAPFFQQGNRVFEFNVEGLKWEVGTPRKKKG